MFTLPAGRWLERQSVHGPVFWTAVFHRAFYLFLIPLPLLLSPQAQIWALIIMTLLMSIPGTAAVSAVRRFLAAVGILMWA